MSGALVALALGCLAAFYLLAAVRSPGWPRRRIAYAVGGLAALGLAGPVGEGSPGVVASLGEGSLAADMVGHAMIVAVAVPFLVLARPLALIQRRLSPPLRARVRRAELPLGRSFEPWVLWLTFIGTQWLFHLGPVAEEARADGVWHSLEHAVFFWTAVGFWIAALAPVPGMRRMGAAERAAYLLAAMPALDLIGAIWIGQGMTAAGAAMIAGMLPIGVAFFIVAARAALAEERTARLLDSRNDGRSPRARAVGVGRG